MSEYTEYGEVLRIVRYQRTLLKALELYIR